ncbi:MAG: NAD(P)-dependent oxidoreductase [Pseudomonadota bacterium]
MKTVLVTGAGGFVCSQLVLAFAKAGFSPIAVDREFDTANAARLTDVRCETGSLQEVLRRIGDIQPLFVIHGAALTTSPAELGLSAAAHLARNTDLLTAALAFARKVGAKRFLFLSSMAVYTPHPGDAPAGGRLTEDEPATGSIPYAAAKRAGEVITEAAAEPGFETLSLRLGNVFGPFEARRDSRQTPSLVTRMREAAGSTGTIHVETPDAVREWCWLPDLADLIAALMSSAVPVRGRVLHAGDPPTIRDIDLAELISARTYTARLSVDPKPHPPVRPPMGSARESVFNNAAWTPIEAALDELLGEAVI